MGNSINIIVAGIPVAGARHRSRRYVDKDTGEWRNIAYNPAHMVKYSRLVQMCAQEAMAGKEPLSGELTMSFMVVLPIPKSMPKKSMVLACAGIVRPGKRPDLSNYLKLAEDSLNGVVYYDDAQIVEFVPPFGKWYGEKPRIEIVISKLEQRPVAVPDAASMPLFRS